jgi:hypothetical protein
VEKISGEHPIRRQLYSRKDTRLTRPLEGPTA